MHDGTRTNVRHLRIVIGMDSQLHQLVQSHLIVRLKLQDAFQSRFELAIYMFHLQIGGIKRQHIHRLRDSIEDAVENG